MYLGLWGAALLGILLPDVVRLVDGPRADEFLFFCLAGIGVGGLYLVSLRAPSTQLFREACSKFDRGTDFADTARRCCAAAWCVLAIISWFL
jgi:hypothetical protein